MTSTVHILAGMALSMNAPGDIPRATWLQLSTGQRQTQSVNSSKFASRSQVPGCPQSGLHSSLAIGFVPPFMRNNNGLEWQSIWVTARLVVNKCTRSSVKLDVSMMSRPLPDGGRRLVHVWGKSSLMGSISIARFHVWYSSAVTAPTEVDNNVQK